MIINLFVIPKIITRTTIIYNEREHYYDYQFIFIDQIQYYNHHNKQNVYYDHELERNNQDH